MNFKYQVLFCIVNAGFSDDVMDVARSCGARGGTVLHGKGTSNFRAEKQYGITIQPDKEVVMIVCRTDLRDALMTALYERVGLNDPAHGIIFALPVDATAGIHKEKPKKEE